MLITGASGRGKSFLASALGHHACVQELIAVYLNTQKRMVKIKMSRWKDYLRFEEYAKAMDALSIQIEINDYLAESYYYFALAESKLGNKALASKM